jgi:hypothetical protein
MMEEKHPLIEDGRDGDKVEKFLKRPICGCSSQISRYDDG